MSFGKPFFLILLFALVVHPHRGESKEINVDGQTLIVNVPLDECIYDSAEEQGRSLIEKFIQDTGTKGNIVAVLTACKALDTAGQVALQLPPESNMSAETAALYQSGFWLLVKASVPGDFPVQLDKTDVKKRQAFFEEFGAEIRRTFAQDGRQIGLHATGNYVIGVSSYPLPSGTAAVQTLVYFVIKGSYFILAYSPSGDFYKSNPGEQELHKVMYIQQKNRVEDILIDNDAFVY